MNDEAAEQRGSDARWTDIYAKVNAWRGECMHHISCAEQAVTETLLALDAAHPTLHVRLRHLTGQKFEDLLAAVSPEGPLGQQGSGAYQALLQYRTSHESFRASLCHGVLKVLMERSGRWTILIRSVTIRARQAEKVSLALDECEATAKVMALRQDRTKLIGILAQLRRSVVESNKVAGPSV